MSGALPGRPRIFRDPIHGDIGYPKGPFQQLIEAVIDTRMFQRLRYIRQNGVLNLVFHGAEHSRFSHAMGVAWVASKIFDAACRNTADASVCESPEQDREDTILAALLHDVGHGPFSHTLEEILKSLSVSFDHEEMTKRILVEEGSDIARALGERRERLVPFIDKAKRDPNKWFYSVVSSWLDADRLDYLLRDSTMAGVWTNRFDLGRLVEALGIKNDEIVVDARARDIVENYLLAMEQMYASVYYHHTNRAASFLLRAVVTRAVDVARADTAQKNTIFPKRGEQDDPLWQTVEKGEKVPLTVYEALDESHVWSLISLWTCASDPTLAELATALKQRTLPKAVIIRKNTNLPPKALTTLEQKAKAMFKEARPESDPKYYIYSDKPERKAYKGGSYEEGYAGSIKLIYADGRTIPIEETERTIATILKDKVAYPSLIVPEAIRAQVEKELEAM
jgi:HD superfamily phosphohydrolase